MIKLVKIYDEYHLVDTDGTTNLAWVVLKIESYALY